MKNTSNRRKQAQRGAAVFEFALSFLLFMSLTYGIMEFGRIAACYNILGGAVHEGARYASVHGNASGSEATSAEIASVVRRWAVGLDSSSVSVSTTWASGNAPGNPVRVQASYTVVPFTGFILSQGLTLQSSSQLYISQ